MPNVVDSCLNLRKRIFDFFTRFDPSNPPPDIIEWARSNVYVSARQGTARAGFYDADVTPYMREILRTMVDPSVREVTLCTGAQVGKTESMKTALAYLWLFDPAPTMIVQPTDVDVKAFGEKRLKPTLEDSPALQVLLPSNRKQLMKSDEYTLTTCNVFLRGAGSPSRLASWAIRYVFMDETDKYPEGFTREGDPVDLLRQRMKTYSGSEKLLCISTPTTETGVIWRQFNDGDRCEYWIPCPQCGSKQPITFKDVVFDNDENASPATIAQTARLKCRACGYLMTTKEKNVAVTMGEWIPTAKPNIANAKSYHLQSIASPWVSLEYLVESFIRAKRTGAEQLRVFVNSELAEPWKEEGEGLQAVRLQALEADYEEGGHFVGTDELSTRARFCGVDVQKDYLVAVVREFALGGASGLVVARRLSGFVELDALCEEYGVSLCCIDARFRTDEVVAACVNFADMLPCYGRTKFTDGAMWSTREQNIAGGVGGNIEKTVTHIFYDQSAIYEYVAEGMRGERTWQLFKGATLDPVYCAEVTAKSKVAGIWQAPPSTADHYADAEKLAMLGAILSQYMLPVNLE